MTDRSTGTPEPQQSPVDPGRSAAPSGDLDTPWKVVAADGELCDLELEKVAGGHSLLAWWSPSAVAALPAEAGKP